jgi:hypothetical protein
LNWQNCLFEEAVQNLVKSQSIEQGIHTIINEISVILDENGQEINQYSSAQYNNVTEYLSNP